MAYPGCYTFCYNVWIIFAIETYYRDVGPFEVWLLL